MMKKTVQFLFIFLAFSIFSVQAQLRITVVDSDNGSLWLRNMGSSAVDIAGYRFAHDGNIRT